LIWQRWSRRSFLPPAAVLDTERLGRLGDLLEVVTPYGNIDVFGQVPGLRVSGVDMLVQAKKPSAHRAVHLVFTGEKIRPEYPEPTPDLGPFRRIKELRLIPLADLARMKLTSFRASDEAHLKDLDQAGLITPGIEAALSPALADRLAQVRARD
jgi:hypothetical protein